MFHIAVPPLLSELYDKYDGNDDEKEDAVCYIGTISASRGITYLIKAASAAGVKLYLAGICHNSGYMEAIEEMPEYECVEYLGSLDRNGIVDLLKKTKIGMATLLNVGQYDKLNNLPTKVYEYMAMGIPSIISDTPYNRLINDEIEFGIVVNPSEVEEIANAIKSLISDPERYRRLSANGRNAVKERFNWDKEVENLKDLYERILHE